MDIKTLIQGFSAAVTPITAIFVAYIAYQQYQTNRYKLRLDLFDKRYKVYQGLMELLAHIEREANVTFKEITQFTRDTINHVFLFDKDISDYINDIRKKAVKLSALYKELDNSNLLVGEERHRLAQEHGELLKWFTEQFYVVAPKKFAKYLRLKG